MAVIGPRRHSRVSVSMPLMQDAGTGSHQAPAHAAAQSFFHPQQAHQPPASATRAQDMQPDRPIGYGAFGVVCRDLGVLLECPALIVIPRRVGSESLPSAFPRLISSPFPLTVRPGHSGRWIPIRGNGIDPGSGESRVAAGEFVASLPSRGSLQGLERGHGSISQFQKLFRFGIISKES
ncbi:unnamed protein product [Bemisia tabaci]|uniref:Uncharacterized protein n=1 Tax=Bemisia tabaci TaxID=7038 RepID=A0A9P0FAD1_BEMTA|nr:unnamed protein product [Bemisia tabaci]